MGYTTEFQGFLKITPPLAPEHLRALKQLNEDRHDLSAQGRRNDQDPRFPSLYCGWVPTKGGEAIVWDGQEKFYEYVKWLQHIVVNHLIPHGYKLNGKLLWRGEEFSDVGTITVKANEIKTKKR